MITRNHTGHRCGASHQKAKLTNEQVAAMRADYEVGRGGYVALPRASQQFGTLFNIGRAGLL